jgi:hypothetical protein
MGGIFMSVHFAKVVFRNKNNIDVKLTVEAPIGKVVSGPQTVAANSTATINPGVNDCLSVLLSVDDSAHGTTKQTFAMATPKTGEGRSSFLESVEVEYTIGDFKGSVQARAG